MNINFHLALFDDILQSSTPTTTSTSPTKNFFSGNFYQMSYCSFIYYLSHLEQPFTQTTTSSSNDANWGAFVETTKHPTTMLTNTPLNEYNVYANK